MGEPRFLGGLDDLYSQLKESKLRKSLGNREAREGRHGFHKRASGRHNPRLFYSLRWSLPQIPLGWSSL